MGTRHLTMIISNGETKVAQYGQWDGYPEGQGATVLEFLKSCDIDLFRNKVNSLRWITEAEAGRLNSADNWSGDYPYLSRDTGAQILNAIQYGEIRKRESVISCEVEFLVDSSDFVNDSLFCEWAYVVDLDKIHLRFTKDSTRARWVKANGSIAKTQREATILAATS